MSSNHPHILDLHKEIAACACQLFFNIDMIIENGRRALAGFLARDARMYLQRGETDKAKAYFAEARSFYAEEGSIMRLKVRCVILQREYWAQSLPKS